MQRNNPGSESKENKFKNKKKAFCTDTLEQEKFSELKPPHRRYPFKYQNKKTQDEKSSKRSLKNKDKNKNKRERQKGDRSSSATTTHDYQRDRNAVSFYGGKLNNLNRKLAKKLCNVKIHADNIATNIEQHCDWCNAQNLSQYKFFKTYINQEYFE